MEDIYNIIEDIKETATNHLINGEQLVYQALTRLANSLDHYTKNDPRRIAGVAVEIQVFDSKNSSQDNTLPEAATEVIEPV